MVNSWNGPIGVVTGQSCPGVPEWTKPVFIAGLDDTTWNRALEKTVEVLVYNATDTQPLNGTVPDGEWYPCGQPVFWCGPLLCPPMHIDTGGGYRSQRVTFRYPDCVIEQ
jgi:hypothetical protein